MRLLCGGIGYHFMVGEGGDLSARASVCVCMCVYYPSPAVELDL